MRKGWVALAIAALLAGLGLRRTAPAASPPASILVLLTTHARDPESSLTLLEAGATTLPPPVATFAHLPEGSVRGALVPGSPTVMVVADRAPGRDSSYAGTLLRVEPGREATALCDGVAHASRPLVTRAGRVFVSRGAAGLELANALRVDELHIDEIDATSGAARVVWRGRGSLAFLAASGDGDELIVYHLHEGGASLLGVDPDRGGARVIVEALAPFARDFTLDRAGGLLFANRDEERSDRWGIERVELASGARRRLYASPHQALAPYAWPGGDVAFSDGWSGLRLLDGRVRAPLGPGVDVVRAVAPDGTRAALWHFVAGAPLPELGVIDIASGRTTRVALPHATHLDVVGFRR